MIYHITRRAQWEIARKQGHYGGDTLESEGFIHCSTAEQVAGVANAIFQGQSGLLLLCIDEERLEAELRYEDCYASGQRFPHLYGPLNLTAVTRVLDFSPAADGAFAFPGRV